MRVYKVPFLFKTKTSRQFLLAYSIAMYMYIHTYNYMLHSIGPIPAWGRTRLNERISLTPG